MYGRKPIPDRHGRLNRVTFADPAAGAELTQTIPANRRWEVLGARWTLVTDATVATRRVHFVVDVAGIEMFRMPSNVTQTATLTYVYFFQRSVRDAAAVITGYAVQALMSGLILPEGSVIYSQTENIQAGDNFGLSYLYVMEWIEQVA